MKKRLAFLFLSAATLLIAGSAYVDKPANTKLLTTQKLKFYVDRFNLADSEYAVNLVPNSGALAWLSDNVPLFECPDTTLEKIYYYRWWAFRKHLKKTPDGFVFTEFITPVNHAGKYNTVSSALGHHINEARWLHDSAYVNQYVRFWLYTDRAAPKPHLRAFSSWLQHSIYQLYLVNPDKSIVEKNLHALDLDYREWENEKQVESGLYWQFDVRDAMEESISGGRKVKNRRPTINSYMYGNAVALAKMAAIVKNDTLKQRYLIRAKQLRKLVEDSLWDAGANFFKVREETGRISDAREELGLIPWYFELPADRPDHAKAWDQLLDTTGFKAPWGITTAERRHPLFRTHGSGHGCEWDGAVWPFATTQSLKALSNLLNNYRNKGKMRPEVFYDELHKYAWAHQKYGKEYLGEYQDEKNGEWLKGDNPRSSYYNHSGFADLIINDLVGIKPSEGNTLLISPLIPAGKWKWFCLDQVKYHGKMITVLWDEDGSKYNKGRGFRIYADGRQLAASADMKPVQVSL